ncbi:diguanylate cyclase [Mycobacterium sp. MAA66]|uniref:sensor domain-containing diguanylate cyclase n=1 Tax=Mycobacterium sp. MAA66 TaxID=3156297 RepID=UPI003519449E
MWRLSVERRRGSRSGIALATALLAIGYVVFGRLAFAVSVEHDNVTSVMFVPEGIALAFCVLFGRRVTWGVLLGQTILSVWTGPSVLGGALIGAINSLECMLGAALFTRWRISPRFDTPRDVGLFAVLVFLVLQPLSATGGVAAMWWLGSIPSGWMPDKWDSLLVHGAQRQLTSLDQIPEAWTHWWIGNSVGQILVTPLLLAWAATTVRYRSTDRTDLVLSVTTIVVSAVLVAVLPIDPLLILGMTYPLVIWLGLRRGLRGVTTANALIAPAVFWAATTANDLFSKVSLAGRLATVGLFVATTWCVFSMMLFSLLEQRRRLAEQLELLARQDPLVPLVNRRYFVERLESLLVRAAADGTPLAAVVFDVDHFKRVNDEYGHIVGDRTLMAIATTCQSLTADDDLAARIGGEEFAVLLVGADAGTAERFGDRLRSAVAGLALGDVHVTVSVGVSVLEAGDSLDDFLNRADAALYAAKRAGRDRVVVAEVPALPSRD